MKVFLLLLISFSVAFGQNAPQEKVLRITNLGGVNTRSGDFSVKPGEFRELFNFDLDRNVGSHTIRFGYDSIGAMVGQDSILGIYGAYYTDGTQQLFIVTDSATVGYGNIYVTQLNSNLIDKDGIFNGDTLTRIATHWPVFNKPVFTMFKDEVYIVNGSAKGLIYDRKTAYTWPPNAPGEPTIIPLKEGDELDGEYRYVFNWTRGFTESENKRGFTTYPVRVKSGRILIKDFQWVSADSITTAPDTIVVRIYRTKANPGVIDVADSAFLFSFPNLVSETEIKLKDSIWIDSIADDDLSATGLPLVDNTYYGRDADGSINIRYGAPMFLSSAAGSHADSNGIYTDSVNIYGVVYACTFVDTATLQESVLSPLLRIEESSSVDDSAYTITLPRVSGNIGGQKINIYRAALSAITFDTSGILDSTWRIHQQELTNEEHWLVETEWVPTLSPNDTILGDFHLLAQVDASDTAFTDTIADTAAYYLPIYRPSIQRVPASYTFSAGDQLYSIKDNVLSFSSIDSSAIWFPTDAIIINADDGDKIIAAYAARGVIRVFKSQSMYNIYQDANGIWNKQEVSNYVGVVAPHSLSTGVNGVFYLTDNGVFREQEGIYKDRYFDIGLVSGDIVELDTLPITSKSDAVGFQHKNFFVLSLPSAGFSSPPGNTFVRFGRTGEWGTWDLEFGGTTLYSTEASLSFVPGDTLYFFKPGEVGILRFGASATDNGDRISISSKSIPLLAEDLSVRKTITKIGIAIRTATADSLIITLEDEEGTTLFTDTLSDMTKRYTLLGQGEHSALYFTLKLSNPSNDTWGNTIIDRIDIYYNETIKEIVE